MKILMLIPEKTNRTAGNWVTAHRLSKGLHEQGVTVKVMETQQVSIEEIKQWDIVHCFHLYKSGLELVKKINDIGKPLVISFTGTDLSRIIGEAESKFSSGVKLLQKVQGVFVFHNEGKEEIVAMGIDQDKINVIPQASFPFDNIKSQIDYRKEWGIKQEEVLFLFAGGIREVKMPLRAVELMERVYDKMPNIRLEMIGPALDPELTDRLQNKVDNLSWVEYRGEVPHNIMPAVYKASDVIINTSKSEGMPNALLEASRFSVSALAHNVSGNRAVIKEGVPGFLYNSATEFVHFALKLATKTRARNNLSSGTDQITCNNDLEREVGLYLEAYKKLCKGL